ncbi:uncharacterized protein IWZ02DRAFT_308764 [Phyllosticta citriasiana]|uniref:uncharacterized protein n=1 Tax=Phyllosticta citriasiana TaxID=595635 RepID=UPI0030FDA310
MGFDYGPDARQRDGDQWVLKRSLIQLKHLLSLGQFSRLSVEIHAQRPGGLFAAERISFHPGRLVAFATLLRSRLLRGGEALGTVNISVHERHDAKVYHPVGDFQESVCRREKWRVFVVRCDDNDSGKSLLAPAKRLPRMLNQNPHDSAWLRSRLSGPQSRREFAFAFPFDGRGLLRELSIGSSEDLASSRKIAKSVGSSCVPNPLMTTMTATTEKPTASKTSS